MRSPFSFRVPLQGYDKQNHHTLSQLFSIFEIPDMIHTDRVADFLAEETKSFYFYFIYLFKGCLVV